MLPLGGVLGLLEAAAKHDRGTPLGDFLAPGAATQGGAVTQAAIGERLREVREHHAWGPRARKGVAAWRVVIFG